MSTTAQFLEFCRILSGLRLTRSTPPPPPYGARPTLPRVRQAVDGARHFSLRSFAMVTLRHCRTIFPHWSRGRCVLAT
jgi:hypothetical protein